MTTFFKLIRGEKILIPLKADHHRADDGPTFNADLVALRFYRISVPVLLRNPIAL